MIRQAEVQWAPCCWFGIFGRGKSSLQSSLYLACSDWSCTSSIACLGAFITILALGIDPMVQQLISTQAQQVESETPASLGRAQTYLQYESADEVLPSVRNLPTSEMIGEMLAGIFFKPKNPGESSFDMSMYQEQRVSFRRKEAALIEISNHIFSTVTRTNLAFIIDKQTPWEILTTAKLLFVHEAVADFRNYLRLNRASSKTSSHSAFATLNGEPQSKSREAQNTQKSSSSKEDGPWTKPCLYGEIH
jgi:hypothetical protein